MNRILLFVLITASFFVACGGGSAGTGTVNFRGKIVTPDNQPVEGAVITVVNTGESFLSGADGSFSLDTPIGLTEEALELEVRSEEITASVTVPSASKDESKVGVELELNKETQTVAVRNYEITVDIVGECSKAFTKKDGTLFQSRELMDGTRCIVRVKAAEDGVPVGGVSVQLQRRRCEASAPWRGIASSRTNFVGERGVAELNFIFRTDEEHCIYRVVAPARDPKRAPLFFEIVRFLGQVETAL